MNIRFLLKTDLISITIICIFFPKGKLLSELIGIFYVDKNKFLKYLLLEIFIFFYLILSIILSYFPFE